MMFQTLQKDASFHMTNILQTNPWIQVETFFLNIFEQHLQYLHEILYFVSISLVKFCLCL